jgi:hypothetical protein
MRLAGDYLKVITIQYHSRSVMEDEHALNSQRSHLKK